MSITMAGMRRGRDLRPGTILLVTVITLFSIPLLFLYLWLFFNSINGKPLFTLLPNDLSLHSWIQLFSTLPASSGMPVSILPVLKNTFIVAFGVMGVNLAVCGLTGYAVSRLRFKGRDFVLSSLLVLKSFPLLILLIATYFVLFYLRLLNTFASVILTRSAMELVMGTWIMKGFFDSIPKEIEEAAIIDGASRLRVWASVMIPLVRPGLIAVAIISFIGGWDDFVFVYTFIFDQSKWTLSVFLYSLISSQESVNYNFLSATSIFYMLPTIVLYSFAQKGLTRGALGGGIR